METGMQSQRRPSGYGWGRNRWGGVRPLDALAGVGVLVGIGLLIWVLVGNRPPPASATQAAGEAEAAPAEAAEAVLATVQTLVQQDETDRARAVLAEAVKQFAGDQPLRLAYGDLLVSAGAPELAYEQFEAALAIGPRTPAIEFTAGALAHQMNNLERAHEHFAAAQASEPTHAEYAMRLGSVQVALGETEAGKASLLRAGVLDPGHAIAWGQLAEVALRENKAEIALGYVDKARAVQPDAVAWRVIEARARKRMGDAQGAVDVLVGLVGSHAPGAREPVVLRTLAESYGLLRQPAEAAAVYVAAAESDPRNAEWAREAVLWYERAGDAKHAAEWATRAEMLGGG